MTIVRIEVIENEGKIAKKKTMKLIEIIICIGFVFRCM